MSRGWIVCFPGISLKNRQEIGGVGQGGGRVWLRASTAANSWRRPGRGPESCGFLWVQGGASRARRLQMSHSAIVHAVGIADLAVASAGGMFLPDGLDGFPIELGLRPIARTGTGLAHDDRAVRVRHVRPRATDEHVTNGFLAHANVGGNLLVVETIPVHAANLGNLFLSESGDSLGVPSQQALGGAEGPKMRPSLDVPRGAQRRFSRRLLPGSGSG